VAGPSALNAGGNITLDNTGNDFVGAVNATGANISLSDANALVLSANTTGDLTTVSGGSTTFGLTNVGADLTATAGTSITQTGALTVNGLASLDGGSITLGGVNAFNAGTLTFNSTGAVSISEVSSTEITGNNTADSLALSSTLGSITDTPHMHLTVQHGASFTGTSITLADNPDKQLVVGENASFSATAGGITVGGTGGFTNFGSLTFNAPGNAVVIHEDCCTLVAGINTAGSLNLASTEAITNTANAKVTVTGDASFTGTSITLANNTTNTLDIGGTASFTATTGDVTVGTGNVANFGKLTFNAPGAVSIREGSDTAITGSNTANSLVLSSAGAITEVGTSLAVTNNANLAGTSINLGNNVGDAVNFGSLTFSSPGSVMISEDSAMSLGTSTAGSLTLASTGAITQTGPLTVTGTGSISAGTNAITLTNTGNNFGGLLTVTGGTVKLTDANALAVQLSTGETYLISSGDLTVGGTSGNLTAVSNGGTVIWNNLTGANVILIAATPSVGAAGITGLNPTTGDLLPLNTTFSNRGDARGTNLVASGELYIVARDIPGAPADSSARAKLAVLDIAKLNPENRLQLILDAPNGKLRLLVDQGAFRFRAGSQFPGGVTTPDPTKTQVFIGNQKLDSTPDALSSARSAAQQSALQSASSDARKSFGTDSVTQQIDMGFAGDVGIAPTMAHSVPLQGEIISTPEGVTESKGGQ
jgi:hypothetical protein